MLNNLTAAQLSIADWIKNLAAIPAKDFSLENVQNFVIQNHVRPESLEKYLCFTVGKVIVASPAKRSRRSAGSTVIFAVSKFRS